jgi:cytosine/adenosine deaminase-related metal-dependent hydrolase
LAECAAAGTGAIGEIGTPPLNYDAFFPVTERRTPAAAAGTRQEDATIVLFAEVLGLTASAQQEAWSWARAQTSAAGRAGISVPIREVGISPHAPYSTPLALVERAAAWARQQGKPLAMHLAESPEELELLKTGTGPFREMLERMGLWDDRLFPVADGIDRYLELLERAPRVLVVHGNYLRPAHWERLAQRRGASVVYCPRTHAFFGHDPYPLAEMLRAGVRVVLGTDSRASNPDLSIWREARHAWRAHRVDPWRVLEMVTRSGAAALGLRDVGTLAVGVPARCNSVPIKPVPFGQLGEALLESDKVAPF